MTQGCILAIDQGTTGSTVLVFDHAGSVRGRAYAEFTQHYPRPGWVEHDAEEILRVTLAVAAEALREAALTPAALRAVGITNQRETVVLWERDSGRPIGRAVVWQDRRTAERCERLSADGLDELVRRRTGLVIDPYFSATKLAWLLDETPGLRRRAKRGEVCFGTIDSWLMFRLSGGRVHATDYSNASRTMLFDIHRLCWDEELLRLLDIPAAMLPEVRPSSGVIAETDPSSFLGDAPIAIAGVAGDQQAALFGQGCHSPGMAKNTYGTGSFVLLHTGGQAVASRERMLTSIAWRLGDAPVEYALEGAIFVTGAAVQWLRDGIGVIERAADTEPLAASLADNDDVYFVPALTGLGAPHWDPHARGLLIGITRGTGKAHLARAVLESMAHQTRDVIEAMQRDTGLALPALRCDGGAAVNRWLMQFQADLLDVPVEVPSIVETTAQGAAYLAGLGVGFWQSQAELAEKWSLAARHHPAMDSAERQRRLRRWQRAVRLARGWALEEG